MTSSLKTRLASLTLLGCLAVAFGATDNSLFGAEKGRPVREKVAGKLKGLRLPPYYAKVVTPEQREQINKIQEEYQPKITDLKAQIAELKEKLQAVEKERDEKIAAVLTPEQQKQVDEAKEAAKQKRAEKKAEKPNPAKPVEPTPPPAEPKPAQ
jgi:Skp family chaperone for outer membrane proteins